MSFFRNNVQRPSLPGQSLKRHRVRVGQFAEGQAGAEANPSSYRFAYRTQRVLAHPQDHSAGKSGLTAYRAFLHGLRRLAVLEQFNLPEKAWGPRQFVNPADAKVVITFYARSFRPPAERQPVDQSNFSSKSLQHKGVGERVADPLRRPPARNE